MWWFISIGVVVAFLIFAALYAEFGTGRKKAAFDRTADSSTNYMLLVQQQNSNRNQNSGGI
jgi:hypothetical protein